ncbi:hypothetical protein [Halomicrobium salinisoli]|uniref:hypothetical protein n=1 Tax=Halomicrobium salinisoli TaxID=2878391 RepID=UPI001CEFC861|nr:hypothetical protein [Halomicrobium salinisoli]
MGMDDTGFDAVVMAALAGVLGGTYVVGASVAMMADSTESALLLGGSVGVTTVVGVLLLTTAGTLLAGQRWARYLAVLAFVPVVAFGYPRPGAVEAIPVFQTVVAVLSVLYLTFRNPVRGGDRSNVDDSESAAKVGSTIR